MTACEAVPFNCPSNDALLFDQRSETVAGGLTCSTLLLREGMVL